MRLTRPGSQPLKDMRGKRVGDLQLGNRAPGRPARYHVTCVCGHQATKLAADLRKGKYLCPGEGEHRW